MTQNPDPLRLDLDGPRPAGGDVSPMLLVAVVVALVAFEAFVILQAVALVATR